MPPGKTFQEVANLNELKQNKEKILNNPKLYLRAKADVFIKGRLIELLTKVFAEKAFFLQPNGFFHGDLHEGNVLIYISESIYGLLEEMTHQNEQDVLNTNDLFLNMVDKILYEKDETGKPLVQLTIIDFGNAHILEGKKQREGMLNLLISATNAFNAPLAFLASINQLLPSKQQIPDSQFEKYAHELSQQTFNPKEKMNVFARLGKAIDFLMLNNLLVPESIIAFSRSLALIYNSGEKAIMYAKELTDHVHSIRFNRVLEKTLFCPIVNQTSPLPAFINTIIVKLISSKYIDVDSCRIKSDISLSYYNVSGLVCKYTNLYGFCS